MKQVRQLMVKFGLVRLGYRLADHLNLSAMTVLLWGWRPILEVFDYFDYFDRSILAQKSDRKIGRARRSYLLC